MKIDIGGGCTNDYCIKRVQSLREILARDRQLWGLPCILDLNGDYWNSVLSPKERNMIRRAQKNDIRIRFIHRNQHLHDIFCINTSSLFRQGRVMSPSYLKYPQPSEEYHDVCTEHWWRYVGAFVESKLIAYISLLGHKDLVLVSQILGHVDYQKTGVMNLILYHVVCWLQEYKDKVGYPKVAMYDFWKSGTDGIRHFKKSMGFLPLEVGE